MRSRFAGLAAGVLGLCVVAAALGQNPSTEREVPSQPAAEKSKVWTLDFRFKDPRIIKVHVPEKGTRIYYYLWYQVINRTGRPLRFNPTFFELVTLDYPGVYRDLPDPTVQEAIRKVEDVTGYQDIKNTVEIGLEMIPVSKPAEEAFPRAITGVAIWEVTGADPAKRDPKVKDISDSTSFSIFVPGLSNARVIVDPLAPGLEPVTRSKTLQLNFRRKTQRFTLDSRDIEFVPNAEWVYRASSSPKREPEKKEPPKSDTN